MTLQDVRNAFPGPTPATEKRAPPTEKTASIATTQAAVALIIRARNCSSSGQSDSSSEAEILLIQRALHPKDPWSGHMAFPGGRRDTTDSSLLDTAHRETFEEVGLALEHEAEPLGTLPSLPAVARGRRTGLTIAPFVFLLRGPPTLRLDEQEVQASHWAALAPLLAGERNTHYLYREGKLAHRMPGYDVDGKTVWGLTHAMLKQFLGMLGA